MRGGAGPAAGFSNNKRDLAGRQPMIMPKSVRAFNHIVHNVPFLEVDGISRDDRGLSARRAEEEEEEEEDKVFRNKYNPRANEKRES